MEIDNLFLSMQKAYYNSPIPYYGISPRHFRFRMSNFTYNLLIDECKKHIGNKPRQFNEFLGVKIELDDMMPDFIFHLYEKNILEFIQD